MLEYQKLVFNAKKWNGKDKGDNSQFWEVATIVKIYSKDGFALADVRWADGSISTGHFQSSMKDVPEPVAVNHECGNDCDGPKGHQEGCPVHCGCYDEVKAAHERGVEESLQRQIDRDSGG